MTIVNLSCILSMSNVVSVVVLECSLMQLQKPLRTLTR